MISRHSDILHMLYLELLLLLHASTIYTFKNEENRRVLINPDRNERSVCHTSHAHTRRVMNYVVAEP